ncbi:hypothetical protein PHLGIDRAFT_114309 [Phlebiopsis gigantea 11061_1 CR5-6]|uniref:Uncharacterized protein n=1 Tax=Phlebiopsis gigantea (strain 11061_1 CR5-6) TaxID=745531 RepID=A0A0C3SDE1_PHLG1|nr:hypothetical protein PHLGIDRAFT_114309 [Phlebiopsis gigantea 11061_1 CR5-6]
MTKRPAAEGDLLPAKRSRSSTSQGKISPAAPRRGRKSLPIGLSLSSSKSSDSAAIRRRMNPESLAGRLGPELVKELEALLKTGITEMPSFAVRQEIQQRYSIDRRHIYDWFHNKGLRVTTSERREERRALRARDSLHVPTTRTMEKKRAIAESAHPTSLAAQAEPSDSESSTPRSTASSVHEFAGYRLPNTRVLEKSKAAERSNPGPLVSQPLDYADPLFVSAESLESTMNSFFGQLSATSDREPAANALDVPAKAYVDRTSHWIAEQQKIPYSPRLGTLSPIPGSEKPEEAILYAISPLDNEKVLPQHQREAYYRSLSDVLPPARGIEECVGTYKEYMSRQGQKYYDRLLYGGSSTWKLYNPTYSPAPTQVSPVLPSIPVASSFNGHRAPANLRLPTSEDFTKWLLHAGRSLPGSTATTPAHTPSLSDTATTASSTALWSHVPLDLPTAAHHREPSGVSAIDLAEILESPVLRARNLTVSRGGAPSAAGAENAVPPHAAEPLAYAAYAPLDYAYGALHAGAAYPLVFGSSLAEPLVRRAVGAAPVLSAAQKGKMRAPPSG